VPNIYLTQKREEYEGLRKAIEGIQSNAAGAKRDLTNEELRSITEMGEKAKGIKDQIDTLSGIELRNAEVANLQAQVTAATAGGGTRTAVLDGDPAGDGGGDGGQDDSGGQDGDAGFRRVGGARTQDRDPGFYRPGSNFSYIGDQWRTASLRDTEAEDRLRKHFHALKDSEHMRDVLGGGATTFGAGLVPPVWMAQEFAGILHRRLRVASVLRRVPWPGSPFPWTIPVSATAAKSTVVAEGTNPAETDPSYLTITVTPKTISGYSEVSRQMLEASNPAVDTIIFNDLVGDFYDNCEIEVITALEGQANVNTITISAGVTTTTDVIGQRNGLLDAIALVSDNSAGDATVFAGRNARWVTYLKFVDGSGRPLILAQRYNPMNAIGQGDQRQAFRSPIQGDLESVQAVTSPTIGASRGFILNTDEILFSASTPQQFRFDQPAGPALIRVGVWGYMAVVTGRRPKAITKISYSGS
jgi:HK97 family phage major capsid protein